MQPRTKLACLGYRPYLSTLQRLYTQLEVDVIFFRGTDVEARGGGGECGFDAVRSAFLYFFGGGVWEEERSGDRLDCDLDWG
jgi:hypothetical protein